MTKKVKSVAFNVDDPIERQMYDYASNNKYFSTYVKRLIQRDMENGQKVSSPGPGRAGGIGNG
ncbi:hypothetical protein [Jeotgalibacillus campisalis]|uniref:Uncharacterized protein n=1 Tax=Jeotgalibacillus campisalis TaxID=220754 RepID=A0A0C2R7C0_9BACL|nr:hypothetical protein [Jeotgalibacillus campisalis]KIL46140.1 hypothetical protein KR50_28150 [Jeotgalibacillus campisalis]